MATAWRERKLDSIPFKLETNEHLELIKSTNHLCIWGGITCFTSITINKNIADISCLIDTMITCEITVALLSSEVPFGLYHADAMPFPTYDHIYH